MNGLMDLFFEWEGKFYILDWKSNYLGDRVEDYSEEQLKTAMAENNYHLQYHLYTLAAVRYLQSRIPEFDYDSQFGGVIYLFVRGVRRGRREGIFFTMPDRKVIEGMDALFRGQNVLA
jgi:exodeoxyribonuclease V beta subunit